LPAKAGKDGQSLNIISGQTYGNVAAVPYNFIVVTYRPEEAPGSTRGEAIEKAPYHTIPGLDRRAAVAKWLR